MSHAFTFLVVAVPLLVACEVGSDPTGATASTALESKSASTVTGSATFRASGSNVTMTLTVSGASEGDHGVHLHAVGDCSSADAMSAMGHWNPTMGMHGGHGAGHLGDCGNISIAADGTGTLTVTSPWEIGTGSEIDIVGKALIVHEMPDDLTTQMPPGNAGARQACGVIEM